MLELTGEEFDAFKQAVDTEQQKGVEYLREYPGTIPDREDRIRYASSLKHATPKYLVSAELRRRDIDRGWDYPIVWDAEFIEMSNLFQPDDDLPRNSPDGRPLTYPEAVSEAKLNYARKFYNDFESYLPREILGKPEEVTPGMLNSAFEDYASRLPDKPGTDITILDVISVLDFYDEYPRYQGKLDDELHFKLKGLTWHIKAQNEPGDA